MSDSEMKGRPAQPVPASGASRTMVSNDLPAAPGAATAPGRPPILPHPGAPVADHAGPRAVPAADLPAPPLSAFLAGAETRLRDLLAFGMAAEAGRPVGPAEVEALRRKADAELAAYAFRTLHNQAEAIRQQAVQEHFARLRIPGFATLVAANLIALVAGAAIAFLLWWWHPQYLAGV